MALGLLYIFPPVMLVDLLQELPAPAFQWSVIEILNYIIYLLSRPLFWGTGFRLLAGIIFTAGIWAAVFFGFMAATVHQSRKGFRVEIVTSAKKKIKR